jgi:hypothetical protein
MYLSLWLVLVAIETPLISANNEAIEVPEVSQVNQFINIDA